MESLRLQVSGMACGNCVRHVQEALQSVEGVHFAHVDLEEGSAVVKGEADRGRLIEAVVAAGYDAA